MCFSAWNGASFVAEKQQKNMMICGWIMLESGEGVVGFLLLFYERVEFVISLVCVALHC